MHVSIAPTEISSLLNMKQVSSNIKDRITLLTIPCRTDYSPIEFTQEEGCDILAIIANDDMKLCYS
jgi:O-succinylbenzoate synthase